MVSDRQNVVADRDIQTPMGQMENAHSHEGQSVVRGGQVVFQRKLAIAAAQIVYVTYFFVIGKSKAQIWMNQTLSEGEYRNPDTSG